MLAVMRSEDIKIQMFSSAFFSKSGNLSIMTDITSWNISPLSPNHYLATTCITTTQFRFNLPIKVLILLPIKMAFHHRHPRSISIVYISDCNCTLGSYIVELKKPKLSRPTFSAIAKRISLQIQSGSKLAVGVIIVCSRLSCASVGE